jgi:hypothetical protein
MYKRYMGNGTAATIVAMQGTGDEAGFKRTVNDLETMGAMAGWKCKTKRGDRSASSRYNLSDSFNLFQLGTSSDRATRATPTSIEYCSVCIWWYVRVGLHVENLRFTTPGDDHYKAMGWTVLEVYRLKIATDSKLSSLIFAFMSSISSLFYP